MSVVARALTAEAYSPFGGVIEADPAGAAANQGTAKRRNRIVDVATTRAIAPLNVCVFRCAPRRLPISIALLEKHPCSTQAFIPMNATRYLVVVAQGEDTPDLTTLSAFVATGRQGISYHPGIWHHPMIALDAETDFTCLVHEDGSPDDCVEYPLPMPIEITGVSP
jgi:ureidoglycolate lyase